MTDNILNDNIRLERSGGRINANALLNTSARFWFLMAMAGQFIFLYYIIVFYGSASLSGDFTEVNKRLIHGFIPGDTIGNFAVAMHLILSAVITFGGPLQLIPKIRARFPVFHRWNGRIYMVTAIIISLGGLYMIWTRGTIGALSQHISISLNGVLIIIFAIMATYYAMNRKINIHRRWALRLFLAVSGVWFFRVGFMLWMLANQGPVGFDPKTFTGPFLVFLAFGQYLIPLGILELYFLAQKSRNKVGKISMAATLFILTILMSAGIFGATMGMWLPKL